tara:strand:- start:877 stop:1743 length:867 start_codon:yes stop_codon:yes gene_type:complete
MEELISNQLSSLTDFTNPFTIYFWILIIALAFRSYLVLLPLRRIYKRYTIRIQESKVGRIKLRSILKNVRVFKKDTSIRGIETFLIRESILAIAPMLAAATIRISLGTPSVTGWEQVNIFILYGVFFLWLLFNIKRSMDMRVALQPLERWYSHPVLINSGLNSAIWSRRKLVQLSQIEIPEYIEGPETDFSPMIQRSEENGKRKLDSSAILDNAKQIGGVLKVAAKNLGIKAKESTKDVSTIAKNTLDAQVQKQVDSVIGASSMKIILSTAIHFTVVLGPLVAIYSLN